MLIASLMLWAAAAGPPPPADVRRYLSDRELCAHFEGEEPYDKARAAFLAKQTRRYCIGLDARLKRLKARYATDAAVARALSAAAD